MTDSGEVPDRVSQLKRIGFMALSDFRGGLDDLSRVTSATKSVLSSLEIISDENWVKEARRQWGQLEILYALVLEDGRESLTDTEHADTVEIVASLRGLFNT